MLEGQTSLTMNLSTFRPLRERILPFRRLDGSPQTLEGTRAAGRRPFEVHDGADPGESVGKDPKQSAIAEAGVRGCLDRVKKRLDFTFDERRRFPFGP